MWASLSVSEWLPFGTGPEDGAAEQGAALDDEAVTTTVRANAHGKFTNGKTSGNVGAAETSYEHVRNGKDKD